MNDLVVRLFPKMEKMDHTACMWSLDLSSGRQITKHLGHELSRKSHAKQVLYIRTLRVYIFDRLGMQMV